MNQRFTRNEVVRMLRLTPRQLSYWTKLRLVQPKARWAERFYSFGDLVALETIKQLTSQRIPARRLCRAIRSLHAQLGGTPVPLHQLRITTNGRQVVVQPPDSHDKPIEPLTGQFVLRFEAKTIARKVRAMASRTAEEWFEIGQVFDTEPRTFEDAVEAYQHARELAPDWVEVHINLGTVLYRLERMEEARDAFAAAVAHEPSNPLAHFNLGCVLMQQGEHGQAITHLRRAVHLSPSLADAHLNLALAYQSRGHRAECRKHLSIYLQYEPQGPWAEFARSQIRPAHAPESHSKLTPFRRKG